MSKKDLDARKALELLQDAALDLQVVAERLCVSREAVDEARCLVDEIDQAETDAVLALPPVLGRALLWAAVAGERPDILAAAVEEGEKEVQREARRIAHNLKHQGVEIALPSRQQHEPAKPAAEAAAPEPPVFLSNLDTNGERAVFWTRTLPGRGIELAQLVISDERGVIDLLLGELSRKRFRELIDELPRKGGVTIRETSRAEALQALDRARVAARESGRVPANYPAWAAQVLGPVPSVAPPPLAPTGEGQPLGDPAVLGELVAESHEIFAEGEMARWTPGEEALRACAAEVEQVATSALHVDELQRREAMRAAIVRCAERFFDEKQRARWATRLLDTGRLFEATGRIHSAKIAAATARMLASGAPVASIPFATDLFGRLFLRQQKEGSAQASASSLLLQEEPQPAAAESAPQPGEQVSAGGIILPD